MQRLHDALWIHDDSHSRVPLLRMTIVRLTGGGLWLHSPTPLTDEVRRSVDALGEVTAIVAPNNAHNLFVGDWVRAYPAAQGYAARGIPAKVPELANANLIAEHAQRWAEDLDVAVMTGVPWFDECVFLHRASGSLIVTDLVQNYEGQGGLVRHLLAPLGWKGICLAPPLAFDFVVTDRPALHEFLSTIRRWPFHRIIVTHGAVIEDEAAAVFDALCENLGTTGAGGVRAVLMKGLLRLVSD